MISNRPTKTKTVLYDEGEEEIERELREGKPQPGEPTELPRAAIKFASSVFQPRSHVGSRNANSDWHRTALADAIRNAPDHQLDPVEVWWSGRYWRVIDGHHRLMAYADLARAKKSPLDVKTVKVEVFKGTLTEAIGRAGDRNRKDKLPMSREDKSNQAWKLVKRAERGVTQVWIAQVAGVSVRTVESMSKAYKTLTAVEDDGGFDDESTMRQRILNTTWEMARRMTQGDRVADKSDPEWIEKEAKRMADRLLNEFGGKSLSKKAGLLARAIEIAANNLPGQMVDEWIDLAEEAVERLREERQDEAGSST